MLIGYVRFAGLGCLCDLMLDWFFMEKSRKILSV